MNRIVLSALTLSFWISLPSAAAPVTFSASGASPASIQSTVDSFRTTLGTLNPNVAGSFGTGRREINWDGVPAAFSAPNAFPANFFNSNSPRGVEYSTPGTEFQVSGSGAAPLRFDNINPTYSSTFMAFSAPRLFASLGSNVQDVNFFIPGSSTAAATSAFGAVFTDVDLSNTTSLEFFDVTDNSLGLFYVPTANNGLSFLGVSFNAGELITRVRITAGNAALGPADAPSIDVVALDDFIYAEPTAAPEPSTYLLLGSGLGCLFLYRCRTRSS